MDNSSSVMKPIWRIPVGIIERSATTDGFIQGSRSHHFLEERRDLLQAIHHLSKLDSYWVNYNQLPVESRKKISLVFRLRIGEKINRIFDCELRHKNRRGDYVCGEPVHDIKEHVDKDNESFNMNGEFGGCCIEGYDIPDECPYKNKQLN